MTIALASDAARIASSLGIKGCDAIYVALAAELNEPLMTFDNEQLTRAAGLMEVIRPGLSA